MGWMLSSIIFGAATGVFCTLWWRERSRANDFTEFNDFLLALIAKLAEMAREADKEAEGDVQPQAGD